MRAIVEQVQGETVCLTLEPTDGTNLSDVQKSAVTDLVVCAGLSVQLKCVESGEIISDFNGRTVTLPVAFEMPDARREDGFSAWHVAEDGSRTQYRASYQDGVLTWTVPHFSDYVIAYCPSTAYTDVDTTQWYHEYIDYAVENGLMTGTNDTTFESNTDTTRGMIVTILYRLKGEPAVNGTSGFNDVASGAWYAEAITWAAHNEIVDGYGNGSFGPDDTITREQMATILYRYAQYKGYDVSVGKDTNILSFDDAAETSEFAIPALQWAVGSGLIEGTGTATLSPQGNATREQAAAILTRFIENMSAD